MEVFKVRFLYTDYVSIWFYYKLLEIFVVCLKTVYIPLDYFTAHEEDYLVWRELSSSSDDVGYGDEKFDVEFFSLLCIRENLFLRLLSWRRG